MYAMCCTFPGDCTLMCSSVFASQVSTLTRHVLSAWLHLIPMYVRTYVCRVSTCNQYQYIINMAIFDTDKQHNEIPPVK